MARARGLLRKMHGPADWDCWAAAGTNGATATGWGCCGCQNACRQVAPGCACAAGGPGRGGVVTAAAPGGWGCCGCQNACRQVAPGCAWGCAAAGAAATVTLNASRNAPHGVAVPDRPHDPASVPLVLFP